MNGPALSAATQDPTLQALVERALAHANAREAATATIAQSGPRRPADEKPDWPPRSLGFASDRGCVGDQLARNGLWRFGI